MPLKFLDLFAGAGGLSEGFIRAGFIPIAHVEANKSACFTLRTRMAWHWLKSQQRESVYCNYLKGNISRQDLYKLIPDTTIRSVINTEIRDNTLKDIFAHIDSLIGSDKLDLIIGGPPCQAYSLVGRSRDRNRMKGDKRNYLFTYYARFLQKFKPQYFIFENVTGLLSAKDEDGKLYFDAMRSLFQEAGYQTEYKVLSAEKYGVLQSRKRVFLVGKKGVASDFFPEPEQWNPKVRVEEVFKDLPPLSAGEGSNTPCVIGKYDGTWLFEAGIRNDGIPVTLHCARPHSEQDLEIYKIAVSKWDNEKSRLNYNSLPEHLKTHINQSAFTDRFKVVASDLPFSHTVVAHIAKDGHYYIHPDIKQNRSITPREAARLQTFPDNYYFEGVKETPSRTAAFHQIGNAVPVLLAEKIANSLKNIWS